MSQMKPDENRSQTRRVATPYLRQVVSEFYRTALDDYRRAGLPFGNTVEAMLIWFEYGQETTVN